jgi:hypothetical protein
MSSFFGELIKGVAIFVVVIVLVAVTASYAAAAASAITNISGWSSNSKLASAHKYLSWAATVGWIYIGIAIAAIVLAIIFIELGPEILPTILALTNLLTVGVLIATGVLSAIGTNYIDQAGSKDPAATTARNKALVASIVSIGSLGIVLIYYIIMFFVNRYYRQKAAKEEALAIYLAEQKDE